MKYQVSILTRVPVKGDIPQTRLMRIIRTIPSKEEAIHVAETLKPHIYEQDELVVFDDTSEEGNVIYRHSPSRMDGPKTQTF